MKTKLNWLEVILLAAPLLALAFYWNELPARVPTHWNFRGQIDSWGNKTPGILIVPLTALGLTALLHILPWFDPKLRRRSGAEGLCRPFSRLSGSLRCYCSTRSFSCKWRHR